jgi:C1A family cysteine protease
MQMKVMLGTDGRTRGGLGWVPDVPKPSDYTSEHAEVAPLLAKTRLARTRVAKGAARSGAASANPKVPRQTDLRSWFPPIEHQGMLGSCTANAAVALLEYFERRASGKHIDASRLFLYKVSRNLLGWTGDNGAYLRTAMEALVLFGVPPERYWPYDGHEERENTSFEVEPPAFCYAFGANYKALKYFRLDPNGAATSVVLENIKAYLAAGFPSMFGFPLYSEFNDPLPGGLVLLPAQNSHYYGGPAIVAVGYDDDLEIGGSKGALLVRNSWGTDWGDAGYAWMTYRYVLDGLADDWWTLISANWVNTGHFE